MEPMDTIWCDRGCWGDEIITSGYDAVVRIDAKVAPLAPIMVTYKEFIYSVPQDIT